MKKAMCETCQVIFMDAHPIHCPSCGELVSVYEVDFQKKSMKKVKILRKQENDLEKQAKADKEDFGYVIFCCMNYPKECQNCVRQNVWNCPRFTIKIEGEGAAGIVNPCCTVERLEAKNKTLQEISLERRTQLDEINNFCLKLAKHTKELEAENKQLKECNIFLSKKLDECKEEIENFKGLLKEADKNILEVAGELHGTNLVNIEYKQKIMELEGGLTRITLFAEKGLTEKLDVFAREIGQVCRNECLNYDDEALSPPSCQFTYILKPLLQSFLVEVLAEAKKSCAVLKGEAGGLE